MGVREGDDELAAAAAEAAPAETAAEASTPEAAADGLAALPTPDIDECCCC
jgi:hypothetical protein